MKYNLYVEDVSVEAVFDKLGGVDGARRFLRNEPIVFEPARSWHEKNGVIYFSITSDGTTGEDWIGRLEKLGFRLSSYAKSVLRSSDFKLTNGVTYEMAVLKGELFSDENRITSKIRAEANKRKLSKPNAEVACLIREKFTDKEIESMGLWWVIAMHEPIKDSDGYPFLLGASRDDDGQWLFTDWGGLDFGWFRDDGFAFVVSQVSA